MNAITAELLVNRFSRRGGKVYSQIVSACERHGIQLGAVHELRDRSALESVMRRVRRYKPKLIIVAGGDGTISYVTDRIAGTGIELGVVPLGTTNNFARSLNLPTEIDAAIAAISQNEAALVDLGRSNRWHFANVMGVGISAEVADQVTDKQKKRYGRAAYGLVGAWLLLRHKPFFATIDDKDGELQMNLETHQLIIANGRFHAGRKIANEARVDNRELIVFAIGGRSKLSFIWQMLDFYVGQRRSIRHSSYLIARNIRITTDSSRPVELDGEVRFSTPARVKVRPGAVLVRYRSTV